MKNKKIFMLLLVLGLSCVLLGSTWAFFNYANTSDINREIITGEVFLDFYNESDEIHLENEFPMNATTARARTDNTITFDIAGRDTYSKPIYYEIDLINGEVASGKEEDNRILAKYLKFDLSEDGELVVGNVSFNDLNNRRIYVTTIASGTETNLIHSYELRMWIDENLMISDTNSEADYSTSEYEDLFASVKVRVVGDFLERNVYGIMGSTWPTDITSNRANVTKINVIDDTEDNIMDRYDAATLKGDMTYEANPITDISNNSNKKYQVKMLANEVDEIFEDSGTDYFFPTGYSKVYVWLEDDPNNTGKYILNIGTTGYTYISSGLGFFTGFPNVTEMNLENLRTDFASDMTAMFNTCSSLTSLDLSHFNTSNVTNMSYMFQNCSSLTNIDVSNFDTSNVINMSTMFTSCSSLTDLDLSNFDTGNVTNMSAMFVNCSSLTDLDLSMFDMRSVTNYNSMFAGSGIINLNLSNWNLASMTSLGGIFGGNQFKNLNMSNWHISDDITSISGFFSCGLTNLETLDVSGWNIENVTEISNLFSYCSKLKNVNLNNWNASNLKNVYSIFSNCPLIENISMQGGDFRENTFGKLMYAFVGNDYSNITSIQRIDVSNSILPVNCYYFFSYMRGNIDLIMNNLDTSNVTSMKYMFESSDSANIVNLDLNDWDVSHVTNLEDMFDKCTSLKTVSLNEWDTSSVTNMRYMFEGCINLESINMSKWDVSHITDYNNIDVVFSGCNNLKYVNISNWDLSNMNDSEYFNSGKILYLMFYNGCKIETLIAKNIKFGDITSLNGLFRDIYDSKNTIKYIDVSGWDVSNVTSFSEAFSGLTALEEIDLSGWKTGSVTNMNSMFNNCYSLKKVDISTFTITGNTSIDYMFRDTGRDSETNTIVYTKDSVSSNILLNARDDVRVPSTWDSSNIIVKR